MSLRTMLDTLVGVKGGAAADNVHRHIPVHMKDEGHILVDII